MVNTRPPAPPTLTADPAGYPSFRPDLDYRLEPAHSGSRYTTYRWDDEDGWHPEPCS